MFGGVGETGRLNVAVIRMSHIPSRSFVLAATTSLSIACGAPSQPPPPPSGQLPEQQDRPIDGKSDIDAASQPVQPAEPLTQEELDLIAADSKTLTPELRRKRAYALRKKIMQNPDSPAARTLIDLQKAIERGEIQPPNMTTFQAGQAVSSPAGPQSHAEPSKSPQRSNKGQK